MYKPDHQAGKLKRPDKTTLTRTDSFDRNLFYGDSKLHKVMVQQSAESFTKVSDSALRLEDSVSEEAKVHVGIIGCGRIGQCHAANLANKVPDAELVCVSDFFEGSARRLAKQYNVPMACTDYKDLINNADVHAIIVCSPTDTHADIIKEAAAAGKHIFCEKPIDKSLSVIDESLAAVEEAGVKLMIGFQKRYDADFGRAYDARAKGFLGTPIKLHLTSRDPAPPPVGYLKNSGGVFLDQTIHDFDMARYLVGSDVVEIYATGVAINPEIAALGDYDNTICHLKFANGCIGTIDNSRATPYGYDQKAEFFGTSGAITVNNNFPNTATYADRTGCHTDLPVYFFMQRFASAFLMEMIAFIDCIVQDTPVPCTGNDGRIPVVYAMAATKSIKENRPVRISEIDASLG